MSEDFNPAAAIFWLMVWIGLFGGVGYTIAERRCAAGTQGFFVGLLFGPIGWLLAAFMRGDLVDCPHCKQWVKPSAVKCQHCGADLAAKVETVPEAKLLDQMYADPDLMRHLAEKKRRAALYGRAK